MKLLPNLNPALRFRLWSACVMLLLVVQPVTFLALKYFSLPPGQSLDAAVPLQLPIAVLVVLLATTPADAIRLTPRRSQWIIILGTVLLQATATAATSMGDGRNRLVIAVIVTGIASAGSVSLAGAGRSPWWIVPLAWNPLWFLWR